MSRRISLALMVVLMASAAGAEEDPLAEPLAAVDQALGAVTTLAFIRPEATGTTDDLSGLQGAVFDHLSARENLTVVHPDEVFRQAGPEFEVSAEGIAGVAKKIQAQAALFLRVFQSPEQIDLNVMLADAEGKMLLDQTFAISGLPPGKKLPQPAAAAEEPPPVKEPPPPETPPPELIEEADTPEDAFERRRVAMVPRQRITGSASVGLVGRHVAVGIHTPPAVVGDWMIVKGGHPISELDLARLAGRQDIVDRIEDDIGTARTYRNLGIGMTLGGFIAAGVATPFFKAEGDEALTGAGVVVGTGLAVGVAGLVLWLIFGPDAAMAETPYPSRHLITREEAGEMIDSHNDTLRRELDLPPPKKKAARPETSVEVSFLPSPRGGAAVFTLRF
jgi:hypothetical protein